MRSKLLALLGSAALTVGIANAGGYQVNLQGQKQIGMGHVGTGLALDQSSIFFNPGALARLRQNGVQVGISALTSKIAYREPSPGISEARTDNPMGTPFQVYASYGAAESPWRFGIGVYTPYGSTVTWGNAWQGRFGLNELTLKTIFIQPTVSYQITDKIGIGAGLVISTGSVNLQRSIPLIDASGREGHIELDGKAKTALGFNVGILVQPIEKLSIGLTYRSEIDATVEGGDVTFITPGAAPVAAQFTANQFDATLPLPDNITLGIGIMPTDKLTIGIDVQRVGWGAYKSLRFDFNGRVGQAPPVETTVSDAPRNYKDAYIYRIGAQYKVSDMLTVRAGGYYDQTPVRTGYLTPETPDADSRSVSAGLTLAVSEKVDLDLSFSYINKKERTDLADKSGGVPGTFKSVAYIPGVGVNYKF
ncbi:OmpP1/FadL family transporter [Rufibacter ruber]|uniref:OmpP1/FadL family transporter n=1 Tax=Rufibacter ruber TaxID=1783499 RepID=UPI00082C87B3|nr:outer membrane protein transport protein [Rufibacter ruber]